MPRSGWQDDRLPSDWLLTDIKPFHWLAPDIMMARSLRQMLSPRTREGGLHVSRDYTGETSHKSFPLKSFPSTVDILHLAATLNSVLKRFLCQQIAERVTLIKYPPFSCKRLNFLKVKFKCSSQEDTSFWCIVWTLDADFTCECSTDKRRSQSTQRRKFWSFSSPWGTNQHLLMKWQR